MSRIDDLLRQHCPNGVEFRPLGEIGELVRGNGIQKSDFTPEGIGCIHYGQIHTHYGTWASETKSFVPPELAARTRQAHPGDLVIATTSEDDAAVGKAVAWLGADSVAVSTDAYIFRHALDPKYVSYFFQTADFQSQKQRHVTGTKVRRIGGGGLAQIRIPTPPLQVQLEVVRVLDLFHSLEAELEAALRAELETRRQQYAHYLEATLAFAPAAGTTVEREPLRTLVKFISGKAHERLVDPDGDIALITARFISTQGRSARRLMSADVLTAAERDQVALVMSDLPGGRALARAFYVEESGRYAVNQRVCALEVIDRDRLDPRFLFFVVDRNSQLLSHDNGVDQTHLKKDQILETLVPVPALDEQRRIVNVLDEFGSFISTLLNDLSSELVARRKQCEYYRDRLLTFEEAA